MPASRNDFAVQAAPEADGAELLASGSGSWAKSCGDFFGGEVDVGEDDDAGAAAAR